MRQRDLGTPVCAGGRAAGDRRGTGTRGRPRPDRRLRGCDGWTVTARPARGATWSREVDDSGAVLRLDYDLGNGTGFVTAAQGRSPPVAGELRLHVPASAARRRRTTLEFKLVDPAGQRLVATLAARRTAGGLADDRARGARGWPTPGARSGPRPARRGRPIEIAISGGEGGTGTVWFDDLVLEPREPVTPRRRRAAR